jgi:hypothetical protein
MSLNVTQLAKDMAGAFVGSLKAAVPNIKDYAEGEAKKMAQSLAMIEKLVVAGTIDEEEAKLHLEIQKNASRTVLLTIEGLGALAVEAAINAALDVVKNTVNAALKFTLL